VEWEKEEAEDSDDDVANDNEDPFDDEAFAERLAKMAAKEEIRCVCGCPTNKWVSLLYPSSKVRIYYVL
jgi:hypothetical protein